MQDGWKLQVVVPPHAVDAFSQALAPLCVAMVAFEVAEGSLWRVEGYVPAQPPHAQVSAALAIAAARAGVAEPPVACLPVPVVDWVAENQRAFQPLRAGRYFVHPSHFDGAPPAGAIALTLDAGAAFGTGEHATTRGCLLALDRLARARRFRQVLDLGCGSGILALAAAATWRRPVLAADIDPQAVMVAQANARRNGLGPLVRAQHSDGFAARELRRGAPYDLIMANILAGPLVALSRELRRYLAPGGAVVLSGLLAQQENAVCAACRRQGLRLVRRIAIDGWHTLVLGG